MLEHLAQSPPLAIAVTLVFGLIVGSFLNVVIHRLPLMMQRDWRRDAQELAAEPLPPELQGLDDGARFNLAVPRSRCPKCGHQISALENIPVLGWLMLRGRCSNCGTRISARYPVVELVTGLLAALAIWRFGFNAQGAAALVFTFVLVAATGIDLDTTLLPDSLTLPLLWLGLLLNVNGMFTPLPQAVIGAAAGYLLLWSLYWAYKLLRNREGMGYGDFKLLAALGAWFGWTALPSIILLSSVVGAVVGIGLMIANRKGMDLAIPFGPYLAGAGLLTLYLREPLMGIFGLR